MATKGTSRSPLGPKFMKRRILGARVEMEGRGQLSPGGKS